MNKIKLSVVSQLVRTMIRDEASNMAMDWTKYYRGDRNRIAKSLENSEKELTDLRLKHAVLGIKYGKLLKEKEDE